MKKNYVMKVMLLLSFFVTSVALAQDRIVSGKVTSADDGSPLPGVNIVLKGTTNGTAADANGAYSLSVPANGVLVFSFIGLATQEISTDSRAVVNVAMQPDIKQLNEIVIQTGYNEDKKYTGAATVLSGNLIARSPVASLDQSLQGRVAGVVVNSGSGQPGASATVRIRGVSSISGADAQPLYVVDGVPVLGGLSGINPNDILSQTILKDAAAGALYGARGANGVIVITTRKGTAGGNSIDFRTQYGVSMQPKMMNLNMMNTEQTLGYEEAIGLAGYGITGPGWALSPQNPSYAAATSEVRAQRDAQLAAFRSNNRNYSKDLLRNGRTTSNEIAVRGGNETSRYYLSFNAFNQDGFAAGSDFDRYTGRVNIDHRVMDKLSLNLSATVVSTESNYQLGDWYGNSTANPFQMIWRSKPYEQVYKPDGTLDFGTSTALAPKTIANVIERQQNSIFRDKTLRVFGGLGLQYEIIKGLTIKNNLGLDVNITQGMFEVSPSSFAGSGIATGNSGVHSEAMLNRSQIVNTTSLNYGGVFSDVHEIDAGIYFEALKVNNNGFGYWLYNLDKRLSETGQGAGTLPIGTATAYNQTGSGAKSVYGIRSYFATAKYTYADKYSVSLNVRQDGTSRIINENNREIFTWSAGLLWSAIDEEFLKSQDVVSDLKVRASYGVVPNIGSIPTGNYNIPGGTGTPGTIYQVPNYLGPQMPTFSTATFAGSTLAGLTPATPGNPNLKIESVKKTNVGFDLGVFNNRVMLGVDVYKNVTVDLFVSQRLSGTTGFGNTNLPINAGQMSNKGIELSLSGEIVKVGDLSVEASWNHAMNVNNIDDLGTVDEYVVGTFIIKKGMPYGTHYTYDYVGADPATGFPTYKQNDGSLIVQDGLAGVNQKDIFGTFLPKHTGGFTLGANYKGISLSTLFSYQFDVTRYNNVWNWVTAGYPGYINAINQSSVLLTDQWMKPGDEKYFASAGTTRQFTSADVMDAKFLRWRELTVSYTLPKIKYFKEVRVYARGQNLKIWSPWKGMDPEDNNNISLFEYPNPRMYVFGLDLTF